MRTELDIIRDHYAASDRRDLDGMMADMAEDVRWTEMEGFPCAGTYVGAGEVVTHVFEALGQSWDDYRFRLERLVATPGTVVGIGEYTAVYRATRKPMRARVVHVWDVREEKIVRFEQFTDTLLVRQAMNEA
jgi:ketosteroid isomerase-like protein